MEATLHALAQILWQAVPTFFLVIFLHFFLKSVFFGPLQEILERRRAATLGAREEAAESLRRAEAKAAEYQTQIEAARTEVYREQEELRTRWRDEQAAKVAAARTRAGEMVKQAKIELAAQAASAKSTLSQDSERLADEIVESILQRRPV